MKRPISILEHRTVCILKLAKFPDAVQQYAFHPTRKWRFDFAYPEHKIAIECEGGVWRGGRHNRGGGFIKDTEKYNAATVMGWRVLRYTYHTLERIPHDLTILFNRDLNANP